MTTTAQHTPGKWRVDERSFGDTDGHIKVVRDHDSYWIASARVLQDSPGEATANARFIVTACNSHDALLEAAKLGHTVLAHLIAKQQWDELGEETSIALDALEAAIRQAEN